jgi:predicted GNAT family acetyltransferase
MIVLYVDRLQHTEVIIMHYQRLDSPQELYQLAASYLLRQEAANNLVLGLVGNLIKQPDIYGTEKPYFGIVWSGDSESSGEIVGVALRTPPRAVILSHLENREAVRLIVDDVHNLYSTLPAVTGDKEDSRYFAELWALRSGQRATPGLFERIYSVDRVIPVRTVPGSARRAGEDDREQLRRWMRGFHDDAFPHQQSPSDAVVENWINNRMNPDIGGIYFWEDETGQPVSMAGYTGFTENGVRIGPVYTPKEFRGHGYGSAVTAAVSQMLLDSGRKFCFLFTDLSNPTSNKIYQNIGYRPVCDIDEYVFE